MTDQDSRDQPTPPRRPLPSTEDFGTAPPRDEWPTGQVAPAAAPSQRRMQDQGKGGSAVALGGLGLAAVITVFGAIASNGGAGDVEYADEPVAVAHISDIAQVVDAGSLGPVTLEETAVLPQAGEPITLVIDSPDAEVADLVLSWSQDADLGDFHMTGMELPLAYTFPALTDGGSLSVSAHRVCGTWSTARSATRTCAHRLDREAERPGHQGRSICGSGTPAVRQVPSVSR